MNQWQVRKAGDSNIRLVAAQQLAQWITEGKVNDDHEMRLDGAAQWLTLAQAKPFLVPHEPSTGEANLQDAPPTDQPVRSDPAADALELPAVPPPPGRPESVPPPPKKIAPQNPAKTSPAPAPASPQSVPPPLGSAQPKTRKRWRDEEAPASPVSPTASSEASRLPTISPAKPSRRSGGGEDDDLDMTPMIDMTFLLLIFFMVTSTLSPFADLQLPEAKAGDAEKPEGRVVLVLDYEDGREISDPTRFSGSEYIELKDCRLYLADDNETPISPSDLGARLTKAFADNGGNEFILQSNRKMPVGVVREVIKVAKAAGAGETMIGVTRPR